LVPSTAQQRVTITEQFKSDLDAMPEHSILMGFKGETLAEYAATNNNAILIDPYSSVINIADGHADEAGNRELAESIQPIADDFIRDICNG
jgi:hypothetical protein